MGGLVRLLICGALGAMMGAGCDGSMEPWPGEAPGPAPATPDPGAPGVEGGGARGPGDRRHRRCPLLPVEVSPGQRLPGRREQQHGQRRPGPAVDLRRRRQPALVCPPDLDRTRVPAVGQAQRQVPAFGRGQRKLGRPDGAGQLRPLGQRRQRHQVPADPYRHGHPAPLPDQDPVERAVRALAQHRQRFRGHPGGLRHGHQLPVDLRGAAVPGRGRHQRHLDRARHAAAGPGRCGSAAQQEGACLVVLEALSLRRLGLAGPDGDGAGRSQKSRRGHRAHHHQHHPQHVLSGHRHAGRRPRVRERRRRQPHEDHQHLQLDDRQLDAAVRHGAVALVQQLGDLARRAGVHPGRATAPRGCPAPGRCGTAAAGRC